MRGKAEEKKEVELPKPTQTLLLATNEVNSPLEQLLGKYFIQTVANDKNVLELVKKAKQLDCIILNLPDSCTVYDQIIEIWTVTKIPSVFVIAKRDC